MMKKIKKAIKRIVSRLLTKLLRHKKVIKDKMQKETGTVKWFDDEKGYGFISREGQPDVFVHQTSIQQEGRRTLVAGQKVEFEVQPGEKGPVAVHVTKL